MFDVAIVGAGPVGLFLGALLLQEGLSVRILEQRTEPSGHSRAIGIHPPALRALAVAGVAGPMTSEGVHIRLGIARSGGREVARLPLSPFVLTLKQARTEAILEERVRALDPFAIVRGFRLTSMHDGGSNVTLSGPAGAGAESGDVRAQLVVGADGARSTVRRLLGIPSSGRDYPDHYLMGDFPDTGGDGSAAMLYLEPGGIVESFPLPGGLRRWVVHTETLLSEAGASELSALILARTGVDVSATENSMLSAFAVRSRLARRLVRGRVALIGDAAHQISPIGGQGMNLGWLDAAALAPIIVASLRGRSTGAALRSWERERHCAARGAVRQAELNMMLGRAGPASFLELRNTIVAGLVSLPPVQHFVSRRFTMQ